MTDLPAFWQSIWDFFGMRSATPAESVVADPHMPGNRWFPGAQVNYAIKASLSPRFVPNEILQVAEIPRTLSGKKQELPIKKLLLGQPIEKVVNREAMANPGSLAWYVGFAARHAQAQGARA